MLPDTVLPAFFEASLYLQYQVPYQVLHPFHHDHKVVSELVHVVDVFFTEIPSIQNEPDIPVTVSIGRLYHALQL